jgi:hypothetical protein
LLLQTWIQQSREKGLALPQTTSPFNILAVLSLEVFLTHQGLDFLCAQRHFVYANIINQAGLEFAYALP